MRVLEVKVNGRGRRRDPSASRFLAALAATDCSSLGLAFVLASGRLEAQAPEHGKPGISRVAWILFGPPTKDEGRPSPVPDTPDEATALAESDRRLHKQMPRSAACRSELPPRCEKRPALPQRVHCSETVT